MRLAAIVLAVALAAPAPAAGPAPSGPVNRAAPTPTPQQYSKAGECSRTTSYFAGSGSIYQGAPLTPQRLAELPPATAYMAVVRKIDGCEIPLTMTEYRSGHRP